MSIPQGPDPARPAVQQAVRQAVQDVMAGLSVDEVRAVVEAARRVLPPPAPEGASQTGPAQTPSPTVAPGTDDGDTDEPWGWHSQHTNQATYLDRLVLFNGHILEGDSQGWLYVTVDGERHSLVFTETGERVHADKLEPGDVEDPHAERPVLRRAGVSLQREEKKGREGPWAIEAHTGVVTYAHRYVEYDGLPLRAETDAIGYIYIVRERQRHYFSDTGSGRITFDELRAENAGPPSDAGPVQLQGVTPLQGVAPEETAVDLSDDEVTETKNGERVPVEIPDPVPALDSMLPKPATTPRPPRHLLVEGLRSVERFESDPACAACTSMVLFDEPPYPGRCPSFQDFPHDSGPFYCNDCTTPEGCPSCGARIIPVTAPTERPRRPRRVMRVAACWRGGVPQGDSSTLCYAAAAATAASARNIALTVEEAARLFRESGSGQATADDRSGFGIPTFPDGMHVTRLNGTYLTAEQYKQMIDNDRLVLVGDENHWVVVFGYEEAGDDVASFMLRRYDPQTNREIVDRCTAFTNSVKQHADTIIA